MRREEETAEKDGEGAKSKEGEGHEDPFSSENPHRGDQRANESSREEAPESEEAQEQEAEGLEQDREEQEESRVPLLPRSYDLLAPPRHTAPAGCVRHAVGHYLQ